MSSTPALADLLKAVEQLRKYPFEDAAERRRAMLLTREVSDELQLPYDKIMEMWGGPVKDVAMKVCIDVKLFSQWKADDPKTPEQLAELVGMDPKLLSTLLRHLATWHIVDERGPNLYAQTEFSLLLARPEIAATVGLQFDAFYPTTAKLPAYLKVNQYTRPTDARLAPVSWAMNYPGTVFEYMARCNVQLAEHFDLTMRGMAAVREDWTNIYPSEKLLDGADREQVLVVDVGGGLGHDLHKFLQKHPDAHGRVVLQDIKEVIKKLENTEGIQVQEHDFFKPQPIQGASAYFLHMILHDWPEDRCVEILQSIKPAMSPSSRLLINEMVIPSTKASMNNTAFDIIMMFMFSAAERTERDWYALVESVGMKIVKIWNEPTGTESVIEISL